MTVLPSIGKSSLLIDNTFGTALEYPQLNFDDSSGRPQLAIIEIIITTLIPNHDSRT